MTAPKCGVKGGREGDLGQKISTGPVGHILSSLGVIFDLQICSEKWKQMIIQTMQLGQTHLPQIITITFLPLGLIHHHPGRLVGL